MDNILHLVGLAKRAGHLEIGDEPVGAACRARACRVILVAQDAADNTFRRVRHFADAGQCLWLSIPYGKDDLGSAVGRTSCAIVAVTDIGFASAIVEKLAQADPEKYGQSAEKLSAKAVKAAQRRREKLAHQRNIQHGHKPKKAYIPTRIKRELKAQQNQSRPASPASDSTSEA